MTQSALTLSLTACAAARLAVAVAVFLAVTANTGRAADADAFDHAGLARQTLERHIRPAYDRFAGTTDALGDRLAAYCAGPPDGNLAPVEGAFRGVVLAWSGVEHLRFGPVIEEHRYSRVLFWPDPRGIGIRQVERALRSEDPSVLSAESLKDKSVALQGLSALELILYGPYRDALAETGPAREHRCGYMQAIARNLSGIAEALKTAWSARHGYSKTFLEPGPDNPAYRSPREVTQEIAKAFQNGLEWVRDVKIAGPIGERGQKAARVDAPYARSRLSTESAIASVESLRQLFAEGGIAERVEAESPGMTGSVLFDLDLALKQIRAVGMPIDEAAGDPEAAGRLVAAGYPLENAGRVTLPVLSGAAGIIRGFNVSDGD